MPAMPAPLIPRHWQPWIAAVVALVLLWLLFATRR